MQMFALLYDVLVFQFFCIYAKKMKSPVLSRVSLFFCITHTHRTLTCIIVFSSIEITLLYWILDIRH
jgi:hypothetical protein